MGYAGADGEWVAGGIYMNSTMSKIRWQMVGMGLFVGVLFPIYAGFFVTWVPERKVFFGIGCLVAGVLVGLINYGIAHFALYKPVGAITLKALEFAEGNLTQQCNLVGSDIIGGLAGSLNKIRLNLRESLANAQQLSDSLFLYVEQLSVAFGESQKAVQEAVATVERISENSVNQSQEVQQVADGIEEIITKIKTIGELNRVVNISLVDLSNKINAGNDAAGATKNAFAVFDKKITDDFETITRLGRESKKIETFINTINMIAQETTLLSLNATIESARAGEHGRGFGVVAEQIGKLAYNTNQFTSEITKLVSGIQKDINLIIENNSRWKQLVEKGQADSDNTVAILKEVQSVTSDASTTFDQVSEIITQVTGVNRDTEVNLEQVLRHSTGNVAYAADVTASIADQYAVNESLAQLNSTIDQLKLFVKKFRF